MTRLVEKNITHNDRKYSLISPYRREQAAKILEEWLVDDSKGKEMELKADSYGNRPVMLLGDGITRYAVKTSNRAGTEFETTLKAEMLTDLTPLAGAVIKENGTEWQALTTTFIDGIPLKLLNLNTLLEGDKKRIINAALYGLGKLHLGDGKQSLLHFDGHSGNIMLLSNLHNNSPELKISSKSRAEIRYIDLEKSQIRTFRSTMLETLASDVLNSLNKLSRDGFITPENFAEAITQYLEGIGRFTNSELKKLLIEGKARHPKFKFLDSLNFECI